jgi:hypothetical protein
MKDHDAHNDDRWLSGWWICPAAFGGVVCWVIFGLVISPLCQGAS